MVTQDDIPAARNPVKSRWLLRTVGLAAAYVITGRLGLMLAIPPGYASPVWLPSGIALAALLVFGYRLWPGVLLGSFVVNAWTSFDAIAAGESLRFLGLSASIGLGAAAQAVAGAWLIRRFVGVSNPLIEAGAILKWLGLGAPASCLVNATWGPASLLMAGAIPAGAYPMTWCTWWIGDALGVLVAGPAVLLWLSKRDHSRGRRGMLVTAPLALTFALVVGIFAYVRMLEEQRLAYGVSERSEAVAQAVEKRLNGCLEVLYGIEALYRASGDVKRQEFSAFVSRQLAQHPGIKALSWNPRVTADLRHVYEEAARRDGLSNFVIREQDSTGTLVPAGPRNEYFPAYYIEPRAGNEIALGFDVTSEPTRRRALVTARDGGRPVATASLTLVQETEGQPGLLVFLPVYHGQEVPASVEERRKALRGFTPGVLRVAEITGELLESVAEDGVGVTLTDVTSPDHPQLLEQRQPVTAGGHRPDQPDHPFLQRLEQVIDLEVAGRTWRLRFVPTLAYVATHQTATAWGVLAGGLLFTGLLGALLLIITGHAATIELAVQERTIRLKQLNAVLETQVAERQRAHETAQRLAAIVETSDDPIISATLDGTVTSWNRGAERIYGYTEAEMIGQPASRLVPPDGPNDIPQILARIRRGEHVASYETVRRRKDGGDLHISLTVSPILDLKGQVVGASAVGRDITERKHAERELANRHRTMLNLLKDLHQSKKENDGQRREMVRANDELRRFNTLAVDRELRMVELKRRINELSQRLGLAPPHDLAFAEEVTHEHDRRS